MNNLNPTLPPDLQKALSDYHAAPQPNPNFATRLEEQLLAQVSASILNRPTEKPNHRSTLMQTLRARPALALLLAILALTLLTGAAYALGRLAGFIPGFGFVQDASQAQILDEPITAPWDDLTLQVTHATGDETRFWVQATLSRPPYPQAVYDAEITLPDGATRRLQQASWRDEPDGRVSLLFQFPPLPAGVRHLTLQVRYSPTGNAGWTRLSLPLRLRPLHADEIIPALPDSPATPLMSETQDGLTLVLENIAPASDKTVLQVALRPSQPQTRLNGDWNVTLRDLDGRMYPLVNITPDGSDGRVKTYETVPFKGGEMLILSLSFFPDPHALPLSVDFSADAPSFTFDPGPNPQVGQSWQLNETLQAGAFTLRLVGAQAVSNSEIVFFFEPGEPLTGVMLYSQTATGAGGETHARDGLLSAPVRFASLPRQPIELSIIRVYYTARGDWQIGWRAPSAPLGVQARGTPAPTPASLPSPTPFASNDPLVMEVYALSRQFDAAFQNGPGWVRILTQTESRPQAGRVFPPDFITSEQWLELDAEGYVIRALWTDRDAAGKVIQQSGTVGNYSLNFTTGESGYNEYARYPFSMDILLPLLQSAAQYQTTIAHEETQCEDGAPCLLVTLTEPFAAPIQNPGESVAFSGAFTKTWIDRQSGLQRQQQNGWILADGRFLVNSTYRILQVEKLNAPPDEILRIITGIILP